MPTKFDSLTPDEMDELARRRAGARARARALDTSTDPAEDAALTAAAKADPDALPLSDDAVLRPAHEVHPALAAMSLRRGRGRPKLESPKQQVTLRLDADVIAKLRASGAGWQARVNELLREWLRLA